MAIFLFCSLPAFGALYKYTDDSGSVGYTDSLANIPEHLRHTAVLIEEESLPEVKYEKSRDIKELEKKTREYKKIAKIESLKRNPYLIYIGGGALLVIAIIIWKIGANRLRRARRSRY
ncbi:MAG: hypothetical protein Kow0090_11400 [Myxococcota bacterium]